MLEGNPQALSGGQRQRAALGRAIVRNPKVFLFDEPLSNLDAKMRVQMRSEISRLHAELTMQAVPRRKARRTIVADFGSFIGLVLFSVLLLMLLPAQQSRVKLRKSDDTREGRREGACGFFIAPSVSPRFHDIELARAQRLWTLTATV